MITNRAAHEFLKKVPLFAELTEEDLELICLRVEEVTLQAGEELFAEGDPGDKAYVIQEGELEVVKSTGGREVVVAVVGTGEVIGEVALLEDKPRTAAVRARTKAHLVVVHKDQLDFLMQNSSSATSTMFSTVIGRWRENEALLRQSEKMAQLGLLTAGIAHELNNPAAAAQRSSAQLERLIRSYSQAQLDTGRLTLSAEQQAKLSELREIAQENAKRPPIIDSLTRGDLEDEIESWLEEQGVADAWELAPGLVSQGYDVEELERLLGQIPDEHLDTVIRWLNATFEAYNLLAEISYSAAQISDIVKVLKSYAYLDQAPVQDVDVHEGLDNTLLMLRHKLKQGISVRREYAPDMPRIHAYGSELNQVWTNILDNAADALDGQGEIVIRTQREPDWVVIEIQDNGPGIPEETLPRLFDPFFTTKPPGKGTGLGLDITRHIIVDKHRGDIKVYSEPGETRFVIRLPVNFQSR